MGNLKLQIRASDFIQRSWGFWIAFIFALSWLDKLTRPIPYVGDAAIVLGGVTLGGYFLLRFLNTGRIFVTILKLALAFCLLIAIYVVGEVFNEVPSSKPIIQLILLGLYFLGAIYILPHEKTIEIIANLWILFAIGNAILWIAGGFHYPFQGLLIHKNLLGGLVAFGLFFIWAARSNSSLKLWWFFGLVVSLIVLLASGSRGAWLTILATILVYVLWPRISAKKWLFFLVFIAAFMGVLSIIFLYAKLTEIRQYSQIASFILKYTRQDLYSGRQVFWPLLINNIQNHPWGYGPGTTPDYFIPLGLSSHNLFLQILLQTGIAGLISFGMIFLLI